MKVLIGFLFVLLIANSVFSFYLWKANEKNKLNISFLESKLDRLDIDTLEKIKKAPNTEINCEDNKSGDWLSATICN